MDMVSLSFFRSFQNREERDVVELTHPTLDFIGTGDTQGILAQYGQVALFLQIVIRGYDVSFLFPFLAPRSERRLTSSSPASPPKLTRVDLGQVNGRNITTDIFRSSSIVLPLSSLSEEDRTLVGGWIGALHGPEGIADDLLR